MKRSTKSRGSREGSSGMFTVAKCGILALVCFPLVLLISAFMGEDQVFIGEHDQHRHHSPEQQRKLDELTAEAFASKPKDGSSSSSSKSSSSRSASGSPAAGANESTHWETKRHFIGSEPISGDWLLDCPPTPLPGYPNAYPIMDIINNWGPDVPAVPPQHFHALCRFDFQRPGDLAKAEAYRSAEVPYILFNHPQAEEVARKWATPGYLETLLKDERYKTEVSHNNHFMYFSGGGTPGRFSTGKAAWRPPTGSEQMSFATFKKRALSCEQRNCSKEETHYYFRVTGAKPSHFIFDELPFYKPKPSIFIKDPRGQRGIHCRFGMTSDIAENHYDGSRNVVGVFGGRRRYILSHPNQCGSMYLLPSGHPSGRHSGDACNFDPACKDSPNSVDWSNPDLERWPKFANLQANEVIMSPGDFLYLPTHWFHYIISLGLNYQCNTRSGRDDKYTAVMSQCGFS